MQEIVNNFLEKSKEPFTQLFVVSITFETNRKLNFNLLLFEGNFSRLLSVFTMKNFRNMNVEEYNFCFMCDMFQQYIFETCFVCLQLKLTP